jgi:Flp pilus assembly pilin Flp
MNAGNQEMSMSIRSQLRGNVAVRCLSDDSGQDLIEYALLTAIIGISGLLVLSTISTKMGAAYSGWNTAGQNAWQPCPPKPATCP